MTKAKSKAIEELKFNHGDMCELTMRVETKGEAGWTKETLVITDEDPEGDEELRHKIAIQLDSLDDFIKKLLKMRKHYKVNNSNN